jgi:hypothetical protein
MKMGDTSDVPAIAIKELPPCLVSAQRPALSAAREAGLKTGNTQRPEPTPKTGRVPSVRCTPY